MQKIRATYRLLGISVTTIFYLLKGNVMWLCYSDKKKVQHRIIKGWASRCLQLMQVQIDIQSELNEEPHGIIMANHRSYLDVFTLLALYPSSIVAKAEVSKWPGLQMAVKLADMILVKRGKMSSKIQTIKAIGAKLEEGKRVILFPEGGIYESHRPHPFQGGSFLMATQLQAPVTPIAFWYHNPQDAWVGDVSFVKHFYQQMGKKNTHITLKVMSPVAHHDTKTLKSEVYQQIDQAIVSLEAVPQ